MIGGINQLQAPKAAKAFVNGTQGRAVFKSERSQGCVSDQGTHNLRFGYQVLHDFPESLTCTNHCYVDLVQPGTDDGASLCALLVARGFVQMRTKASNVCQGKAMISSELKAASNQERQTAW